MTNIEKEKLAKAAKQAIDRGKALEKSGLISKNSACFKELHDFATSVICSLWEDELKSGKLTKKWLRSNKKLFNGVEDFWNKLYEKARD